MRYEARVTLNYPNIVPFIAASDMGLYTYEVVLIRDS